MRLLGVMNFVLFQSLFAQNPMGGKINILSPNADSFKVYDDIPVSLYTGVPQISIPLHSVETNDLNINITINYHASGFKPDSHPSWIGLGWNLNVGGVINREIKYLPDENNNKGLISECDNTPGAGLGFYYSYNVLNRNNWKIPNDPFSINSQFNLRNLDIDTQPDIFSFNFLGYSGKFYLNHNREWKVQCDVPIKVIFEESDIQSDELHTTNHFRKFTIIDEKGVKYIFGGENAIEYTQSMFPCKYSYSSGWQAISWFLKEIIPPVGENILFNYERGPYQSFFSCYGGKKAKLRSGISAGSKASDYALSGVSGTLISPVYLLSIDILPQRLKIIFDTSKSNDLIYPETNYKDLFYDNLGGIPPSDFLGFDATYKIPYFDRNQIDKNLASLSGGFGQFKDRFIWLKLNKITFKYADENNVETLSKNIQFSYSENSDIRRKLASVNISHPSSSDSEIYNFEYEQSLPSDMMQEPEYLSEFGDHWGYSNNKFLWKETDCLNSPKAPIKERAKLGVLSKIIYPTKGYTMLIYENNDYGAYVPASKWSNNLEVTPTVLSGGLRIKKIINVSQEGQYTSKEYDYTKYNRQRASSGILHAKPTYYTSNGLLFDNSGSHLNYSSVLEKKADGSFKATHFITEDGITRLGENVSPCFDDLPIYVSDDWEGGVPYSKRDMERGKVSDEYFCDSFGKIYKSIHYSYVNIGRDSSNFIRTIDQNYLTGYVYIDCDNVTPPNIYRTSSVAYYYYCYSNKLSHVREIQYSRNASFIYGNSLMPYGDIVMNSNSMEYDKNKQIIKAKVLKSNGEIYQTITKYPYTKEENSVHKKMVECNMLSYPTEQRKYVNNILLGGYDYVYTFLNNKHVLLTSLKEVYRNNSSAVCNEYQYNAIGKLIGEKGKNELYKSYLWDYKGNNIRLTIDNVNSENMKNEVSNDVIDCSSKSVDWNSLTHKLRNIFPNSFIKLYDYYYNKNVKKITDISSISYNFAYDKNDRLEIVSDHDQRVTQRYGYNYRKNNIHNTVYLNQFTTLTAQKQCPTCYISQGESARLDIPAGTFLSTISQADADKMVIDKYAAEVQTIANDHGNCIRYQDIMLLNGPNANIISYNASIEGDELVLKYIYLNWADAFRYYTPSVFRNSVEIAVIKDDNFFPQKTTCREFEMYGNTWTIAIALNGCITVQVSKEKNIYQIPNWEEGFQVIGDFRFPLK